MKIAHYLCHILKKLVFSRQIFEKYSNIKFHGILLVGTEMLHAVGRKADVTKFMAAFRNFANAPKNDSCCSKIALCSTPM